MKTLQNQVALVTGAAQGLGPSVAEVLTERGINVVLGDVNLDKTYTTARLLKNNGVEVIAQELDIGNESSVREAVAKTLTMFGKIDILVNNVGVDITKSVFDLDVPETDKVLNKSLRGIYIISKLVLSEMMIRKEGQIVNVASIISDRTLYNATSIKPSRWGIVGLSRALYAEASPYNCRVSVVVPSASAPAITERFPESLGFKLQAMRNVAEAVYFVLSVPDGSIATEVMVLPQT